MSEAPCGKQVDQEALEHYDRVPQGKYTAGLAQVG